MTDLSTALADRPLALSTDRRVALTPIRAEGKFLWNESEKFWIKGVTYGTFQSAGDADYPARPIVERDFAAMAANGINTVRTYTPPPRWLLDCAAYRGLRVLVGLPWEQHIAFLDEKARRATIPSRLRLAVRDCAGHPAVLGYTVGNEIPGGIVRWHGRRQIERFVRALYDVAKEEDPDRLVTYVNFPTTEYLDLPFLDFVSFNVFLERRQELSAYLGRLQNLAGERPLILTEIGLDSRSHGKDGQAEALRWQINTVFTEGCAGTFVFAWTDEWFRGGSPVEDWDFGLVDRAREPKPALNVMRRAYAEIPFPGNIEWPPISVVVCSLNGARTIRDTLNGLRALDYPNYEVIVVNDGSTDATPDIAGEYPVRLISTPNRGLSSARNTGWQHATGEIVAYIDDDAYPDPHWLKYLAWTFISGNYMAVGGPNLAPPGDGQIAACVANAPGGPVHVLISDREAEHIPGCNMSFRRAALDAIGGFDTRYRTAGDDVDVCWRLQDRGWKIGFHGAAMVWHHRRNSIRMFWRQQLGYGRAESLLEEKWPERYNTAGHVTWTGRLYGNGLTAALPLARSRVYSGSWGSAPFQRLYLPMPGMLTSTPLMPEWFLLIAFLGFLSVLGLAWSPLYGAAPAMVIAIGIVLGQAALSSSRARFTNVPAGARLRLHLLVAFLHVIQPVARLIGRIRHGLTPWRRRADLADLSMGPRKADLWSEIWKSPQEWLGTLERSLRDRNAAVRRGGDFDAWDIEVRCGASGSARVIVALEEHGEGRQLCRIRWWPQCSTLIGGFGITLAGLAVAAGLNGATVASAVLAALGCAAAGRIVFDLALASHAIRAASGDLAIWCADRQTAICRSQPSDDPITPELNGESGVVILRRS